MTENPETPAAPLPATPPGAVAPPAGKLEGVPSGASASPDEAARQHLMGLYVAVGASVILVYASFHPLDLGALAWFALVPWWFTAFRESRRVAIATSYCATFLYHLLGLSWIALVTAPGWIATTFLEGFYSVGIVLLARWMRAKTRLPLAVLVPPLWVMGEHHRGAHLAFMKFPWIFMGHTQHDRTNLIQIADVTSVYGLSFLVVAVNAFLTDALLLWDERRRGGRSLEAADVRRLAKIGAYPATLLLVANVYGAARAYHVEKSLELGPRVLAVQADLPQSVKESGVGATEIAERHLRLTRAGLAAAGSEVSRDVDAIIWSETVWLRPINRHYPDYTTFNATIGRFYDVRREDAIRRGADPDRLMSSDYLRAKDEELFSIARNTGADLLVGSIHIEDWKSYFLDNGPANGLRNSVYQIGADAKGQVRVKARYDKINLVPASEGIPGKGSALFGWFYSLVKAMVPPQFESLDPGEGPVIMELSRPPHWKLAPCVCFEVSFPELLRESTRAGADVLVCPSNDGWFHTRDDSASAEIPLAYDHAQLRAIENRRGMVRCVNRGITCIIDPLGRKTAEVRGVELGREGRVSSNVHVEGSILEVVPTTRLVSFYVRFGDVFAWGTWVLSAVLMGLSWQAARGRGPLAGTITAPST